MALFLGGGGLGGGTLGSHDPMHDPCTIVFPSWPLSVYFIRFPVDFLLHVSKRSRGKFMPAEPCNPCDM